MFAQSWLSRMWWFVLLWAGGDGWPCGDAASRRTGIWSGPLIAGSTNEALDLIEKVAVVVSSGSGLRAAPVRKVYTLTEKGRQTFKVAVEAWMEVTQCPIDSGRAGRRRSKKGDVCCG